jgi:hypothetical protein
LAVSFSGKDRSRLRSVAGPSQRYEPAGSDKDTQGVSSGEPITAGVSSASFVRRHCESKRASDHGLPEHQTEPLVNRQSSESAIESVARFLSRVPAAFEPRDERALRTIHKRSDRVSLPGRECSPVSSRNVDRFLDGSKLMILAVVTWVCNVPVMLVESGCASKRGF